ncbi:MAG: beta-lactamase family protein [Candidatus Krumholzibacteriota bacterium]|nr:beta-lactamase family protein [Candidatus Krumholzibacteriota bacterium]
MKRPIIALVITMGFALGPAWAHAGDQPAVQTETRKFRESTQLLETWIESVIDFDRLPGLSVAVVHDQDIIYAKGFGHSDIASKQEAGPGTIYGICSMSKMFTALAVMQLRDAGKLELDDPVSRHLPWFAPEGTDADQPPTLRDLLRHTGGLPCEPDLVLWDDPRQLFPARDEFIDRARRSALSYPFNTRFNYSNLGYSLLGEVVAAVSGMPYEDYVRRHLLDPLGMKDTMLSPSRQRLGSRLATGYGRAPRRQGPRVALADFPPGAFAPAGGYYSSALDMAAFAKWQFRVLDGKDDRIIGRQTLEEMQTVQWPSPKWGLGFTLYWIGDLDLYGHQGGCSHSGFKAQFILCPEEKLAVAVMINASDAPQFPLAFVTYQVMSEALKNAGEDENEPNEWSRYTGTYTADRAWSEAEVLEWEGSLAVLWVPAQHPLQSLARLRHVEGGVFRQVDAEGEPGKHFVFGTDGAGNVGMKFYNNVLWRARR